MREEIRMEEEEENKEGREQWTGESNQDWWQQKESEAKWDSSAWLRREVIQGNGQAIVR